MNNQIENQKNQTVHAATLKQYLKAANLVGHLTEVEIDQFIQIAQAFGLNPFKREIYASKYGNNFSIVVGYETYIKRAERSGLLGGWKVNTEGVINRQKPNESTLKAVITIHRKDFQHPFEHEVHFSEYYQTTRSGELTKFWREKPITMIKKVVISQGFRLCFSDELGGLPYTKEEIGNETIDTDAKIVEEPKQIEEVSIEDQLKEALNKLKDCKSREDCVKIWKGFPDLQTNEDFVEAIKQRSSQKEDDQEAIEVEAEEIHNEEETTPENASKSVEFGIKDALFKLNECDSIEEVVEFTEGDNRKRIVERREELISAIKDNEEKLEGPKQTLFNDEE